jgi:outer membrane protein OmpA-like peptidoglycan-associated protein
MQRMVPAAAGLAAFLASSPAPALEKYADPDAPAVRAAARAALAGARVLDVKGRVLDIAGLSLGVQGLLQDLGARVTAQEIRIELQADVLFDFDKAVLRAEAESTLRKVAEVIRSQPGAVTVEGYTDSKGSDAYNQRLSESRAASVRAWLAGKGGVQAARIAARGFGEARPVAPNTKPDGSDDPEGRQRNRRVEIAIRKASGS